MSHVHSSVSHPESQGALERFHQALKFDKDWDEGIPLPLFAMREVVQESVGFSPSETVEREVGGQTASGL